MPPRPKPISLGSPRFTTVELPALRVSDVWFPPGGSISAHTHDRPVFAMGLHGFIDSQMARRTLECGEGWTWTEPAGEVHANGIGPEGARVLVILPDPAEERRLEGLAPLMDEVHQIRHGGLTGLARRMASELDPDDDAARLSLQGLALETLGLGLRGLREPGGRESLPAWLREARDLVHDRFREGLDIAEVAEAVGVDGPTLARAFRKQFRIPLGTYQRRLRLDWAADKLVTSEVSLAALAVRAGFYDQSHFTRHFRRHTGQPPGEYRRHRRG